MMNSDITQEEINQRYQQLLNEAKTGGYHLHPDIGFTNILIKGLLVNEKRYGYPSCPCRLATAKSEQDIDIICPCYYRDPDLDEHGSCYCGLYVTSPIVRGEKSITAIPERRPPESERLKLKPERIYTKISDLSYHVWRCQVCGYLCARESPPEVCPICHAKRERFERFM
jgi:ferredoxin-thioredoxin reductase catalytic subunit